MLYGLSVFLLTASLVLSGVGALMANLGVSALNSRFRKLEERVKELEK